MIEIIALFALMLPSSMQDGLAVGQSGSYAIVINGERQGSTSYQVVVAEDAGLIVRCETLLSYEGKQVKIESQTYFSPDGAPSAYRLTAGEGNQQQILEVDFAESNAICTFRVGGVRNDSQIALPERWMIFDNNSAAHLAVLAARLKPGMDPDGGQIFVPSTFTLADFYIASQGAGLIELDGESVQTQFYKMILANKVEVELHVMNGQLLLMRQPAEGIEFILER